MLRFRDLIASGNALVAWNLRSGSLLDITGNGNTLVPTGTHSWTGSQDRGVYCPNAGSNYLTPGNPVALQLSTLTLIAACTRIQTSAAYHGVISKPNAYMIGNSNAAEPKAFGAYDYTAGVFRSSTFTPTLNGRVQFYGASIVSGAAAGTTFYANGNAYGSGLVTLVNQASGWRLGCETGGNGLGGAILFAAIINRVLTPQEHADLYDEWMNSGYVTHLGVGGCEPLQQGMSDSEYARQGIVLDTDFVRQSATQVRDMTGNYPGTITGVPVPGANGEGLIVVTNSDDINWGDVTQLNSASTFSLEQINKFPAGNFPGSSYLALKYNDATHNIIVGPLTGAAGATKKLYVGIKDGTDTWGESTAAVLRGGCSQHMLVSFNGPGLINSDKLQVDIDGEPVAMTYSAAPLPAATPNLAAKALRLSSGAACPRTVMLEMVRTPVLSSSARRAAYLRWARTVDWQVPGEDIPVSLVASVASPLYIGPWQVQSGTWKVSETSDGKRWLECVTAGAVIIAQPNAFGTWVFTCSYANPAAAIQSTWFESTDSAGTARYQIYSALVGGGRYFACARNGANLFYTPLASPYSCTGIPIQFCVNRRPSDGRFTIYAKGQGISPTWLLLPPDVGYTNPSVADVTSVTSAYMALVGAAGDKWLINDPAKPGACIRHYVGQLDPTRGEIP